MNSKTVPFAVLLAVALIVGGALIYYALQGENTRTVEIEVNGNIVSTTWEG